MVPLIVVQTETSDPSAYSGEPELLALTTDCWSITWLERLNLVKHLIKVVPAVHLRYSPDKQEKANQATSPGHHDALIDELYPEVRLTALGGINGTQLEPLKWTTVFQK